MLKEIIHKATRKLGMSNTGKSRLFLRGKYLKEAGFEAGTGYSISYKENEVKVSIDENGSYKAAGVKGKSHSAMIDIRSDELEKSFNGQPVEIVVYNGEIYAVPVNNNEQKEGGDSPSFFSRLLGEDSALTKKLVKVAKTFGKFTKDCIERIRNKGLRVLSLFDGISAGRQALKNVGLKVDSYCASEVEDSAIQIAKHNHLDIIEIGDVREIDAAKIGKVDLLLAGSPCQNLSRAGSKAGMAFKYKDGREAENDGQIIDANHYIKLKGDENVEFLGESFLFYEFIRILRETKPTYFFLENVLMDKLIEKKISIETGIAPIEVDSQVCSPQSRKRLYWSNLPRSEFPPEGGKRLVDILDPNQPHYEKDLELDENPTLNSSTRMRLIGRINSINGHDILKRVYDPMYAGPTLNCCGLGGNREPKTLDPASRKPRKLTITEMERYQGFPDNYTLVSEEDEIDLFGEKRKGKQLVSNSARKNGLGNSWQVNVITIFFQKLKDLIDGKLTEITSPEPFLFQPKLL